MVLAVGVLVGRQIGGNRTVDKADVSDTEGYTTMKILHNYLSFVECHW